ncbi:malate dehydrogenase (oxaloacetate-decarboxylating) [Parelusimicrobium proximum]|uniref:NAD(P)-dependent malic enzyme n=1 Tax=Parelusimicrobium proximum TaxID=3228953 RepID=UPI003D184CE0
MTTVKPDITLNNLDDLFAHLDADKASKAKTIFLKRLALKTHTYYRGKISTLPKAALPGANWFNVWYTPGVSAVSTTIRDCNAKSFSLSNRGNTVAVVSDSTRVLGDGDCTPAGGLGVMEGKAYLMKYLGGIDAVALCMDSKNDKGVNDPQKIIDFVLACQHSFGAVNLEDISQPNCYRVLDELRAKASIPVWHDDAQGTACIIMAGLINSLKLAGKKIETAKIVFFGAGAANSMCATLALKLGADGKNMILIDNKGPLHSGRDDIKNDKGFYKQWALCEATNPARINSVPDSIKGADVLIALSAPGPDTVKKEWVASMADKAIVFACANPVPEIYPHAAKEAGAFITATGRGDMPNQLNNSVCFPGILKGALLCEATTITDNMALASAKAIAAAAEQKGLDPDHIVPVMTDTFIYPMQAKAVAEQAIKDGVAKGTMTPDEIYDEAMCDIMHTRNMFDGLSKAGFIKNPPQELLDAAYAEALKEAQ